MTKELHDFMIEIYALKHIIRYNNVPKIVNESVAEHSFFVASIVLELYKTYDFNLETALIMAITHDYIETYISDIPRNVKNKYPVLNEAIKKVETKAWEDVYPEYSEYNKNFETEKTVESIIVKLADSLSIMQYTETELRMGNYGYMLEVSDSVKDNLDGFFKKLETFRRSE